MGDFTVQAKGALYPWQETTTIDIIMCLPT